MRPGKEGDDIDDEGNEAKMAKLMERDVFLTEPFKTAMAAYLMLSKYLHMFIDGELDERVDDLMMRAELFQAV